MELKAWQALRAAVPDLFAEPAMPVAMAAALLGVSRQAVVKRCEARRCFVRWRGWKLVPISEVKAWREARVSRGQQVG